MAMLNAILQLGDRLLSDFSLRRLRIAAGIMITIFLGLVAYEASTHHFRLQNFQARAEALKTLAEAAEHAKNSNIEDQFTAPIVAMAEELQEAALKPFEPRRMWQAFASSAFWLMLVIACFFRDDEAIVLLWFSALAIVSGLIGYFVPVTWHWGVRYVLVPVLSIFVLWGVIMSIVEGFEEKGRPPNSEPQADA